MTTQDPDLDCSQVVELVTDYLEGALATPDAEQLEQHLLICGACQTYVDQHRTVIKSLSRLAPQQHTSERARNAALELFRRMRKGDQGGGGPA